MVVVVVVALFADILLHSPMRPSSSQGNHKDVMVYSVWRINSSFGYEQFRGGHTWNFCILMFRWILFVHSSIPFLTRPRAPLVSFCYSYPTFSHFQFIDLYTLGVSLSFCRCISFCIDTHVTELASSLLSLTAAISGQLASMAT